MKKSAVFYLGEAFAPDGEQKRTECCFIAEGDALLIDLPKWAFVPDDEPAGGAPGDEEG